MRSWDMGTGEPWEWRGRGIAQVERRKWDWGQREGWWSKNCEGRCGTRGVGHVMCNGGLTRSQQNYNRILEETWLPSACIHFNHGNDRKSEGEPSLLTNDLLSYTMHFLWSSVLIISSPGWSLSPGVFVVVWWKLQLMYWETRREYWKLFFFTVKSFLEWASWWSQLPLGPNWHLQLLQLLFRYIEAGGIPSILFHYIPLLFSTIICWYPLPFWLPFYFMCARGASSRSG